MSWASRRRANAWRQSPSESSPLEVDRSSYATFTGSFSTKQKNGGFLHFLCRARTSYPLWTITSAVAIGAALLYRSLPHSSSPAAQGMYDDAIMAGPISEWDHNHYVSSKDIKSSPLALERNLLIAQIGESPVLAQVTSRPNRAYARRFGWDYLLRTGMKEGENASCSAVHMLNHIISKQGDDEQQGPPANRAPYDAILFLSQDAVIMDLDYRFLGLLPDNKLIATGKETPGLFMWNLSHIHSPDVAKMWLDLGDDDKDSMCDTESLAAAIEMTMGGHSSKVSTCIETWDVSADGLVEPRLIKLLPTEPDRSLANTVALWESVADSVCYRYYPRCEVL